ncbi:glycosyltransferase family 2 protein [Candidatus Dependentiae bacterium]|nr:glycosyltransferase family 2 protein [Candidatus Dependentiae bacterium]
MMASLGKKVLLLVIFGCINVVIGNKISVFAVSSPSQKAVIPLKKTYKIDPFLPANAKNLAPSNQLLETILKDYQPPKKHHLVVVIPSYNNAQWYECNLASVIRQDYDNFSVIYTDDASPDGTGALVREYLAKVKAGVQVKLIQNSKRQGACANLYTMIHSLDPESIVLTVDGDDWLATPRVLSLINKVYNKYDVLLTYGTLQRYPYKRKYSYSWPFPARVIEQNSFRSYPWVTTQLRTFKAGLYQKIKKEDLCWQGSFFQATGDMGFMFPVLEMAGKRSMHIPDVLYIYNRATPINDSKIKRALQAAMGKYIRSKKKYQPLPG